MKYWLTALCLMTLSLMAAEFTYTENDNSGNNVALGYPVPLPIDSLTPIDGFRSYNSLNLRHKQLAEQADWIIPLNLGTTIVQRTIWGYMISDSDNTTQGGALEGSALINGGIHAREWQSPEAVTGYMERLFEQQDKQHIEQYILENLNLVLIPILNIDGFLQTQRYPNMITSTPDYPRDGRMRRKNMREVDEVLSTENDSLLGVDLNRNNNPYWATSPNNSSDDNTSIVHHGSGAASEPETQALQNAAVQAGEDRLRFYTDTHSFTQIYFTPMTGDQRRDAITANLAGIMRAANDYKYRYGPWEAGSGIGATDEYFAHTYQIPSYTLEIEPLNSGADYGGNGVSHDGFILPASEVSRMRQETSAATMAGLYAMAEVPFLQEIKILQGEEIIFHQAWQVSNGERNLVVLQNSELVADTEYQLITIFNKPMRQLDNDQVSNFAGLSTVSDISLEWQIKSGENQETHAIDTSSGQWLTNDFSRYKTDSYQVSFSLPAGFDWNGTSLLALNIQTTDMTGQALDTNPATVTDWQSGHWTNYEDSHGELTDTGGTDKSMRLIDDGSDLYPDDTPNPVEPVEPETPEPGSGGGSLSWLGLLLLLMANRKSLVSNA